MDKLRSRRVKTLLTAVLAVMLTLLMAFSFIPSSAQAAAGEDGSAQTRTTVGADTQADPNTLTTWLNGMGEGTTQSTYTTGRVWTDKSVSTEGFQLTNTAGGETINVQKGADSDFLVGLSALSSAAHLTQETMVDVPLDIVLVLDRSGSMDDLISDTPIYSGDLNEDYTYTIEDGFFNHEVSYDQNRQEWGYSWFGWNSVTPTTGPNDRDRNHIDFYQTKIQALKAAVDNFIDQTLDMSTDSIQHQIGIVSYSSSASTDSGLTLVTAQSAQSLKNTVNGLNASGATAADYALESAQTVLNSASARPDAQKVVIFFTDGEPNHGNGFDNTVAAAAINAAHELKSPDGNNAIVYSIGVFEDANPSTTNDNFNKYMNAVSSNYPEAIAQDRRGEASWNNLDLGTRAPADKDYYYAAENADDLNAVFEGIAGSLGSDYTSPIKNTTTVGGESQPGYITFTDQLGDYMKVDGMQSIVFADDQYTESSSRTTGNTTTYTYQQVINGHPVYGDGHDLSEIQITVTRAGQDDLKTGDEIEVKIPASLLPLRQFYADVDEGGAVTDLHFTEAYPIRVFYNVSLKDGVVDQNGNLTINDPDYINANTEDGKVNFYSNAYNGGDNGATTATFEPASTNTFYYYTDNTLLYTNNPANADGTPNVAGATPAEESNITAGGTFYYLFTWQEIAGTGNQQQLVSHSQWVALSSDGGEFTHDSIAYDDNGNAYIKENTPRYSRAASFTAAKETNTTVTATNAIAPQWDGQDVTVALGNNGRLQVDAALTLKKTVTADVGLTAPEREFSFTIAAAEKADKTLNGTLYANDQDTTGTPQEVTFDASGNATVTLKAGQSLVIPEMANVAYSITEGTEPAGFALTDITGADTPNVDQKTASGTVDVKGETVTFTNRYSVTPATSESLKIDLDGTKTISGREFQEDDSFTFTIDQASATPDAPMPKKDGQEVNSVTITPTNGSTTTFAFDGVITFNKPGEYRYIIREAIPADGDKLAGVDYDMSVYRLNILVEDKGDGTLGLTAATPGNPATGLVGEQKLQYTANPMVQVYNGETMVGAENNAVVFNNDYKAASADATIQGMKTLTVTNSDRILGDGEFTFKIEALGSNTDGGDTFTADDTQPQTTNANAEAKNMAHGNVQFNFAKGAFTQAMVGKTYGYKITEVVPGNDPQNGITYDADAATGKIVKITVGDDGQGYVTTTVTPNENQSAVNFRFTNSYQPSSTTIGDGTEGGIQVQKTFTGRPWTDKDTFEYTIENTEAPDGVTAPMPADATIEIGKPADNGTVNTSAFGAMTFEKKGSYVYTITETKHGETDKGITYDSHTATVTVTVEEDEATGTLSVESITYNNAGAAAADAAKTDIAAFTNTYTSTFDTNTTVNLRGAKELTVNGGSDRELQDREFTFEVVYPDGSKRQMLNGDVSGIGGPGSIQLLNGITYSQADMGGAMTKDFVYTAYEIIPTDKETGMTYDASAYQITVTVTDNGEGVLSAGEPKIVKGTYADGAFTADVDQAVVNSVVFNNVYTPQSVTIGETTDNGIEVQKTFTGRTWTDNDTFEYTIKNTEAPDGVTAPMPADTTITIGKPADGTVNTDFFGDMTFDTIGQYVYEITETNGGTTDKGVAYDGHTAVATVNVTDVDGQLVAKVTYTNTDAPSDTDAADTAIAAFTNVYTPQELPVDTATTLGLKGTKTLPDRGFEAGDAFTFTLEGLNNAPMPKNDAGDTVSEVTIQPDSGETADFRFDGTITYTQAGTYVYEITEVNPNIPESGKGIPGVTYDRTTYRLTVTVEDDQKGNLSQTSKLEKQAAGEDTWTEVTDKQISFVNTYNADAVDIALSGTKDLQIPVGMEKTLEDNAFTFVLTAAGSRTADTQDVYAPDPDQPMPAGATADAQGVRTATIGNTDKNITFGSMTFNQSMIGKEFLYQIREVQPTQDGTYEGVALEGAVKNDAGQWVYQGVTYDKEIKNVTAKVYHDNVNNKEIVRVDTSGEPFVFTNSYLANPVVIGDGINAGIRVQKTLDGRAWKANDSFRFTLTAKDGAPMPEGSGSTCTVAGQTSAAGSFAQAVFGSIRYDKAGVYTYSVTENDFSIGGVTKDTHTATVTVTVKDPGNGQLTASVAYSNTGAADTEDAANTDIAAFTNTYEAAPTDPVSVPAEITKVLEGRDIPLQAGEFSFTLTTTPADGVNNASQTKTNAADGKVAFDPLTFSKEGTYTVSISETKGSDPLMTYDGHTYSYTVTVTDKDAQGNQTGKFAAEISNVQGSPEFKNTYNGGEQTKDVQQTINGAQTSVNGKLVGVGDELTYVINWINNAQNEQGQTVAADVVITDTIPAGTEYVENSADNNGVYDNGVITWNLGEQQPGATGKVTFKVKVTEAALDVDSIANTADIKLGDNDPDQTNTVETSIPKKEETTHPGTIGEGTVLNYQIRFTNTDGDNAAAKVVDTLTKGQAYNDGSATIAINDGEATALAPTVAGDAAGGQTLTWNINGLAADAEVVIDFKVTVTRDAGTSVDNTATVNGHSTNTTTTPYPPGDDGKDVVATDDPTTSINGKLVGVGDKLTYVIDWAADDGGEVVVTDKVPAGTEFVKADNGGTLEGDTVTWNLGDQPAGQKGTVSFDVVITEAAVNDKDAVTNTASITVGDNAPKVTNEVKTYVPDKEVTGEDEKGNAQVGDELTYTIHYINTEAAPAKVTITDKLSTGLDFVSADNEGQYNADDRTVTWTLENVSAGQEGTVSVKVKVNESALNTSIDNTAAVQVGDDPAVTTDTEKTPVNAGGDLVISKTIELTPDQGTVIDTEKAFTFTITVTGTDGEPLTCTYGVKDSTEGIDLDENGQAQIKLKHEESITITGLPEGAQYSVVETAEAGYTSNAKDNTMSGTIPAAGGEAAKAKFVNTYSTTPVPVDPGEPGDAQDVFTISKAIDGRNWMEGDSFTFNLTAGDAKTQKAIDAGQIVLPEPASVTIGYNAEETDKAQSKAFGGMTFKAAGTYVFNISEQLPEGVEADNPVKDNMTYDTHTYQVTVVVRDNGDGSLGTDISGSGAAVMKVAEVGSSTFTNRFTPSAVQASLKGTKVMDGRDLKGTDTFEFTITGAEGAPMPAETTVKNSKDGSIQFAPISFSQAGVYEYTIKETGGSAPSVTNSTEEVKASVAVDYDKTTGLLSVASITYSTGDANGFTITNLYDPGDADSVDVFGNGNITKTVTPTAGNAYTMEGGEFSFTITPGRDNPASDPLTAATVTNDADGSVRFADEAVYTEAGTYVYTIAETNTTAKGMTLDSTEYTVTVEVTDNTDAGRLETAVTITDQDGRAYDAITFDNGYDPAQTSAVISGQKVLDTAADKALAEGDFTFILSDADGNVLDETQNTAAGAFQFDTLTYTVPGTYQYTVREQNDGREGYTYDSTIYDVTVEVTDVDGALQAVTTIDGADSMVFTNGYAPTPVVVGGDTSAPIGGTKTLEGRTLNAGEFTFTLNDADGNPVEEVTNAADGSFAFSPMTFDTEGVYYYTVAEKNGKAAGITYDTAVYTVKIAVEDVGGHLEAAVTYLKQDGTAVDSLAFTNTYQAAGVNVTMTAIKKLEGADLTDGQFTFVLKDADGKTVQEVTNTADGRIPFDTLTFDAAGEYTYTMEEVKGSDRAIAYDDTVYPVVINVTDDGNGALNADVTYTDGDPIFVNTANQPTTIIDNVYTGIMNNAQAVLTAFVCIVVAILAATALIVRRKHS